MKRIASALFVILLAVVSFATNIVNPDLYLANYSAETFMNTIYGVRKSGGVTECYGESRGNETVTFDFGSHDAGSNRDLFSEWTYATGGENLGHGSLILDAVGDDFTVSTFTSISSLFSSTKAVTIELLIRQNSEYAGGHNLGALLCFGYDGSSYEVVIGEEDNGVLSYYARYDGGVYKVDTSFDPSDGEWYYVALVLEPNTNKGVAGTGTLYWLDTDDATINSESETGMTDFTEWGTLTYTQGLVTSANALYGSYDIAQIVITSGAISSADLQARGLASVGYWNANPTLARDITSVSSGIVNVVCDTAFLDNNIDVSGAYTLNGNGGVLQIVSTTSGEGHIFYVDNEVVVSDLTIYSAAVDDGIFYDDQSNVIMFDIRTSGSLGLSECAVIQAGTDGTNTMSGTNSMIMLRNSFNTGYVTLDNCAFIGSNASYFGLVELSGNGYELPDLIRIDHCFFKAFGTASAYNYRTLYIRPEDVEASMSGRACYITNNVFMSDVASIDNTALTTWLYARKPGVFIYSNNLYFDNGTTNDKQYLYSSAYKTFAEWQAGVTDAYSVETQASYPASITSVDILSEPPYWLPEFAKSMGTGFTCVGPWSSSGDRWSGGWSGGASGGWSGGHN